jgi:ankyrin repeat protein
MSSPTNHTQEEIGAFVIAAHGDTEKAKALLAADPTLLHTRWERTGETALDGAAHTGQADLAVHLLAAGAPLDIFTAAMLGRTEDVIAFLDSDPTLVNAGGAHGIPLLVYAGLSGKVELLDLLVERGGGKEGHTGALHAAARRGYVDVARWVLDRGADTAATDFAGKTPLQQATERNDEAMIALLREYGATA